MRFSEWKSTVNNRFSVKKELVSDMKQNRSYSVHKMLKLGPMAEMITQHEGLQPVENQETVFVVYVVDEGLLKLNMEGMA